MWLLRAFLDAVIAAFITAGRAWLALIWRPWESTLLIAGLPRNLWRTRGLLRDLLGSGLAIMTPPGDAPVLRTAIIGLGDLTTRVVEGPTLTSDLVSQHFGVVREKLEPLRATPEALARLSALGMAAVTVYFNLGDEFDIDHCFVSVVRLVVSAFIVSFTWVFGARLFVLLGWRVAQRWFDRKASG